MRLSWGECKNGEYQPQPSNNGKHCDHKFSMPVRLLDSFTQNLSIMISIKISIMIETYWINFGCWKLLELFPRCPLKSRLSHLKFKTILPSIRRHGNVNSKVTYVHYIYIFDSFFTSDNNLHTVQASDARWKESENWLLSLFLHILKCKVSWKTYVYW